MNTSQSIEQLEATSWPEPPYDAPPHVHRCHKLRRVPIEQLSSGELRALVTQDVGLKYLMPTALQLLTADPLLNTEYYPGDLLCASMGVRSGYWSKAPKELAVLRQLAEQAQAQIAAHPEPAHFRQVGKDIARFQAQSAA